MRQVLIAALIFALSHAPLPVADYHNIRHHDAPGQLCEYHNHLLKWHPDAGDAQDVAILHWHWLSPSNTAVDPASNQPGPGLHAGAPEQALAGWDTQPTLPVASVARNSNPISPRDQHLTILEWTRTAPAAILPRAGPLGSPSGFISTYPPHVSLCALLQRYTC